jgi:DNA mismatch endonuclease, patch repair protein
MNPMASPAKSSSPLRRRHRGDIMSPEKRSALMARIRGKGTKPELAVAELLRQERIIPELHAKDLPGRPDFVLRKSRVAIFVDGDFWHGWRFGAWRLTLSEEWEKKIESNRLRDARNHRLLRRRGWTVIRIWEHQIENDPILCANRIMRAINVGLRKSTQPGNLA